MITLSTDDFTYSKATRSFSADASDFGSNIAPMIRSGFTMKSSKTGKLVKFVYNDSMWDAGDLLYWSFYSDDIAIDQMRAIIFND